MVPYSLPLCSAKGCGSKSDAVGNTFKCLSSRDDNDRHDEKAKSQRTGEHGAIKLRKRTNKVRPSIP